MCALCLSQQLGAYKTFKILNLQNFLSAENLSFCRRVTFVMRSCTGVHTSLLSCPSYFSVCLRVCLLSRVVQLPRVSFCCVGAFLRAGTGVNGPAAAWSSPFTYRLSFLLYSFLLSHFLQVIRSYFLSRLLPFHSVIPLAF